MKYLKSINESKESDIIDYINFCFVDILEDNNFNSDYTRNRNIFRLGIEMKFPPIEGNAYIGVYNTNINQLLERNKSLNELILDIDISIKRFNDRYPDIDVELKANRIGTIYINFIIKND